MSRADKIIPKQKVPEYYSDFQINMGKNLISGQMARITNEDAVKQSIIGLILTGQKERPYQSWLGSKVKQSLFDNIDDELAIDAIKKSITDCIRVNDRRAEVLKVNVQPSADQNGYNVEIIFSILNLTVPQVAQIFLTRVR